MIVSFGAGVQSTALLVLAARGEIPHQTFVFSTVGDDAEHPDTLTYLREHHRPFAEAHGLDLVETCWVDRKGNNRDLYVDMMETDNSIPIPVRLPNGAFGNRKCTHRYKIDVVNRWMRQNGATRKNPMRMAIGFSVDEIERAKSVGVDERAPYRSVEYPLLDLGIRRSDCLRIVAAAGLPQPPRSACWFCPFKSTEAWRETRRARPDLWAKAIELEQDLNRKRTSFRAERVFLHGTLPLDQAVDDQLLLPGFDCGAGGCDT